MSVGVLAQVVGVALATAAVVLWTRFSGGYSRDVQIVEMRNQGLSAAEIADVLNMPHSVIQEDLKRLTIGLGE